MVSAPEPTVILVITAWKQAEGIAVRMLTDRLDDEETSTTYAAQIESVLDHVRTELQRLRR